MSTVSMLSSHCSQRTAQHWAQYLMLDYSEFVAKFITYQCKINLYWHLLQILTRIQLKSARRLKLCDPDHCSIVGKKKDYFSKSDNSFSICFLQKQQLFFLNNTLLKRLSWLCLLTTWLMESSTSTQTEIKRCIPERLQIQFQISARCVVHPQALNK